MVSLCSVLAAPICLQDGLVCRRRIVVVISQVLALVRALFNLIERVASEETLGFFGARSFIIVGAVLGGGNGEVLQLGSLDDHYLPALLLKCRLFLCQGWLTVVGLHVGELILILFHLARRGVLLISFELFVLFTDLF